MFGLDCPLCGEVAIESNDGIFYEGDGGPCLSCGQLGQVELAEAYGEDQVARLAIWVPSPPAETGYQVPSQRSLPTKPLGLNREEDAAGLELDDPARQAAGAQDAAQTLEQADRPTHGT